MEHRTMPGAATTETMTLYDTLEAPSLACPLNIDLIANFNDSVKRDFLADRIKGGISDSKFSYKIKALRIRFFKMTSHWLVNPGSFLF